MEATFKIEPQEFNEELFLRLKHLFKGKTVTISISTDSDETEYLTKNKANQKHLLDSIAQEPSLKFSSKEFKGKISKM